MAENLNQHAPALTASVYLLWQCVYKYCHWSHFFLPLQAKWWLISEQFQGDLVAVITERRPGGGFFCRPYLDILQWLLGRVNFTPVPPQIWTRVQLYQLDFNQVSCACRMHSHDGILNTQNEENGVSVKERRVPFSYFTQKTVTTWLFILTIWTTLLK